MLIRSSFVSNSSSSSFILGVKGKLTQTKLVEAFGVDKTSLLYPLSKELAKIIINCSEKTTKEEYLKDSCLDEAPEIFERIKENKMTAYCVEVDDQNGNNLEAALCNMKFNYESDDLIIEKEAGY